MSKLYSFLWPWTWLWPIVVCGLAAPLARRLTRGRWPLHVTVVLLMLAGIPSSIYLQGLADPTTIDGPGPGDGFVVLVHVFTLIVSLVLYLLAAWLIRSNKQLRGPNMQ